MAWRSRRVLFYLARPTALWLFALMVAWSSGAVAADYVGVEKCGKCHKSKALGRQSQQWASTAHARAYDRLASGKASMISASLGIAQPQRSNACLSCHSTIGAPDPQSGVGCESCHGPGSQYSKVKMLNLDMAIARGLIPVPQESVCNVCHEGKRPCGASLKFDYASRVKKIEH